MTVIDHMSYREEQYRLQLRAARDEADARAREKRRAASKLMKARAEADASAREAAAARDAVAVAAAHAVVGSEDGGGVRGGQATTAARAPAAAATHAAAVAALASSWWFRGQPDFPSISHKVVAALAVPLAVLWALWALGRPAARAGARSVLAGAAFLLGFCASSWVSLGAV